MDRSQYLQNRNTGQIDIEAAWEMYNEIPHPTPKLPVNVFADVLQMMLSMNALSMELYFAYYDIRFNIVKLIKKDGSVSYH